jgi:hypothetical protein
MPVNKVNAAWSSGDLLFKNASKVTIATLSNTGASLSRKRPVELVTGDQLATITEGIILLNKGSAIALTLAAPTTGTDDGKVLHIRSETAQAHTITLTSGAYNGGATTVATLTAAIANGLSLVAYLGTWWVFEDINVSGYA